MLEDNLRLGSNVLWKTFWQSLSREAWAGGRGVEAESEVPPLFPVVGFPGAWLLSWAQPANSLQRSGMWGDMP